MPACQITCLSTSATEPPRGTPGSGRCVLLTPNEQPCPRPQVHRSEDHAPRLCGRSARPWRLRRASTRRRAAVGTAAVRSRLGPAPRCAAAGLDLPAHPAFFSRVRGPGAGGSCGASTDNPAGAAPGQVCPGRPGGPWRVPGPLGARVPSNSCGYREHTSVIPPSECRGSPPNPTTSRRSYSKFISDSQKRKFWFLDVGKNRTGPFRDPSDPRTPSRPRPTDRVICRQSTALTKTNTTSRALNFTRILSSDQSARRTVPEAAPR